MKSNLFKTVEAGRPTRVPAARAILGGALCFCALHAGAQSLVFPGNAAGKNTTGSSGNLVFCNGLESILGCAGVVSPDISPVIVLEQLSPLPNLPGGSTPIQFRAGWPLIFRASVKAEEMLGIGRIFGEQAYEIDRWNFAEVGQGASVVFADPDGQWSYSVPSAPLPHDELVVDFYPDPGDVSGVVDDFLSGPLSHDPTLRFNLRPEFGGPLPQSEPDGTRVQLALPDGVQFGADDDFPGLVILSNVGVGIVLDSLADGWNPASPRQARNLAGFTNSVGYELSDAQGRTSVTTTMIVPRFLFSHIRLQDPCVGSVTLDDNGMPISCSDPPVQRIDGGPMTPYTNLNGIDESLVEIRAFVVAPVWNSVSNRLESLDTVVDMNADGRVTAVDAELMGRQVLSNEVVFNFRQIGSNVSGGRISPYASVAFCNGAARPDSSRLAGADYTYDVDGNGYGVLLEAAICPGGGSGVTQPPR
jgi:hypothetical protein